MTADGAKPVIGRDAIRKFLGLRHGEFRVF